MKTEELIDMLARGPDVGVARRPAGRVWLPLLAGVAGGVVLMAALLHVRTDLATAFGGAAIWIKSLFAAALAAAGLRAAARLSAPGARTALLPVWVMLPLLAIWLLAALALWQAPPDVRAQLLWGRTWRVCPFLIALIALPVFAGLLSALRRRAPTRLRLAGAAAGLAAGAVAALIYCLHCPETSPVFVGVWYVLGIAIPTAAGAIFGPRVLAW